MNNLQELFSSIESMIARFKSLRAKFTNQQKQIHKVERRLNKIEEFIDYRLNVNLNVFKYHDHIDLKDFWTKYNKETERFYKKGNFLWAVEMMKQGKKVRRPWYGSNYWHLIGNHIHYFCNGNPSMANISTGLIEATDWEIYND